MLEDFYERPEDEAELSVSESPKSNRSDSEPSRSGLLLLTSRLNLETRRGAAT